MSIRSSAGVVVVGIGPGGLRTVELLRRRGYAGPLTLIGAEPDPAYDRPALSKQFLVGGATRESVRLRDDAALTALEVTWRLGERAESLDLARRAVVLSGGKRVPYDALVIATGSEPRRPGFAAGLEGVHYLRTVADAATLREALAGASALAVVGAGFVGCEVAAAARTLGLDVTLVDAAAAPLAVALGADIGGYVGAYHEERGVRVRCGVAVAGLAGGPGAWTVRLGDGSTVKADEVLVGVGASPVVEWLAGSGLALDDGVLCDSSCRADAPGVFAVGDVARWFNPAVGEHMRVEHWTNAMEQPAVVADNVLAWLSSGDGADYRDYVSVPYFWSDQFDLRIQFAGHFRPGDVVEEQDSGRSGRLVTWSRDDRLVAGLAVNAPRGMLALRASLVRDAAALVDTAKGGR